MDGGVTKLKGFRKSGILLIILLLTIFLIPPKVAFAKDYKILSYEVDAEVLKNGDIKFIERVKYDFNGDYNGAIRKIDLDRTDGIEGVKVEVIMPDGSLREIKEEPIGSSKEDSHYEISGYSIKEIRVFEKSSYEVKTFQYSYTLKNVAEKSKDISEVNRKFVDSKWNTTLNMVTVNLKIPEGAKKEDLKIFAHGDLLGVSEIIDNRNFRAQVAKVSPGEYVEILAVFPRDLLSELNEVKDRERLPSIMASEKILAEEANAVRDRAKAEIEKAKKENADLEVKRGQGKKLGPFFIGAAILGLLASIFTGIKFGKETKSDFTGEYYRELPGEYGPAVMSHFLFGSSKFGSKEIMATILDLARKKAIEIIPYKTTKNKLFKGQIEDEDYILKGNISLEESRRLLNDHEAYLYNWFINELGTDFQLKMDDLEAYIKVKRNGLKFANKFEIFKNKVRAKVRQQDFFMDRSLKGAGKFIILSLLLIVTGVLSFIYFKIPTPLLVFAGGLLILLVLLILALTKPLSPYGASQKSKWFAFRKFLLDFSNMDKSEIPSLTIWNHYLVYATALGVAKEVIAQLPKVFSMEELEAMDINRGGYYPIYYGNTFSSIDRSINRALTTSMDTLRKQQIAESARSSSSGGGGGFSGGSSGGGGGGGGGGAF